MIGALVACSNEKEDIIRQQAASSNDIIMSTKSEMIFTANIDVDTVTMIDSKTKKVKNEIEVGKQPVQLVLSPDEETLYVSCRYDNRVDVIDVKKQKVVDSIKTGIEPYGLMTSQDGKKLYVANYRENNISAIDLKSEKVKNIEVGDRPRTLAISKDGKKLYATNYLNGEIKVIDTVKDKVSNTITLASSPDQSNRKKSQGTPNTLEQFVISPDGKTAWVSHLLTNTDTPVQFDETIFPAISVIDLEKEKEKVEERKELFEEINVTDRQNQTMIVSNPYDIVFQPDGSKAYVVMSGSEDLVVFDLKRGGNAVQVLRRIEGDNPRGAVLSPDGKTLFVHNAMSHDLATIDTGGDSSYGRAKMAGENIKLIEKDSLDPLVREGKTIFYSGNSDEYATDITGDNWMSCISCHADGEINGLSISTVKGPRNIPSNVLTTETGLFMWDGSRDDFTDYLLTVQGEMGGMMDYDPSKPLPKEVEHMYDAMFAYLKDPNSFPVPKSPYRKNGELTADAEAGKILFEGKGQCLSCHGGKMMTDSVQAIGKDGNLSTDNTQFLHDIGTGSDQDQPSDGDGRAQFTNKRDDKKFDTPTLRGVWATAPYFHDGSAKTIEEAVTRHNYDNAPELSAEEIDKIAAYVKSIE
ncbi:beta-propeller fold lactonase family protein [Bacillus sp. FJAT-52991]|uniref:Beta-propeller fold lactonase family protein n=2 Tax=Bacillus kandeliae TaxID=3129297 RepID=A0ABZ2NB72_9BACI